MMSVYIQKIPKDISWQAFICKNLWELLSLWWHYDQEFIILSIGGWRRRVWNVCLFELTQSLHLSKLLVLINYCFFLKPNFCMRDIGSLVSGEFSLRSSLEGQLILPHYTISSSMSSLSYLLLSYGSQVNFFLSPNKPNLLLLQEFLPYLVTVAYDTTLTENSYSSCL